MITITNSVNMISDCDKVMVVSKGRILEYDKPSVLIEDQNSELTKLINEMKEEKMK